MSYMAVAENKAGEKWICATGDTSCEITNLPCGQQFDVYVSGIDGSCMGARGNVEVIQTGGFVFPCFINYSVMLPKRVIIDFVH